MTNDADLRDFVAETDAEIRMEETAEQGNVEACLPLLYSTRQKKNGLERDLKTIDAPVREWLNRHPDEHLYHEGGYEAYYSESQGKPVYDLDHMAAATIQRLLELHCLVVDTDAVDRERAAGRLTEELPVSHYKGRRTLEVKKT